MFYACFGYVRAFFRTFLTLNALSFSCQIASLSGSSLELFIFFFSAGVLVRSKTSVCGLTHKYFTDIVYYKHSLRVDCYCTMYTHSFGNSSEDGERINLKRRCSFFLSIHQKILRLPLVSSFCGLCSFLYLHLSVAAKYNTFQ